MSKPKIVLLIVLLLMLFSLPARSDEDRIRTARLEKSKIIGELFKKAGVSYPPHKLYIRVFKHEAQLEAWAQDAPDKPFMLLKTYDVCMVPGTYGPKREQGDGQVPEGFYRISFFHPTSAFYLSMKINYPNESDKILGTKGRLGGDIFIHGDCVSIGCIPIRDEPIKELFVIAYDAHRKNGPVPVHLFPARMTDANMAMLKAKVGGDKTLLQFWQDLKPAYDAFEAQRRVPDIRVDTSGRYHVTPANVSPAKD